MKLFSGITLDPVIFPKNHVSGAETEEDGPEFVPCRQPCFDQTYEVNKKGSFM